MYPVAWVVSWGLLLCFCRHSDTHHWETWRTEIACSVFSKPWIPQQETGPSACL